MIESNAFHPRNRCRPCPLCRLGGECSEGAASLLHRMDLGGETHDATVGSTLAFLFFELTPNRYGNLAWYPARKLNEFFIPREINLGDPQCL